jgi:pantoate--beta-alanine ligase
MRMIPDADGLRPFHGGVLVPTMGALHEGHFALIRQAVRCRDELPGRPPVVVSIFVNPTQFNDPADLARYPRSPERDAAGCRQAGADIVFSPSPEVVYPPDRPIPLPPLPPVATKPALEDAHRPGHFAGVCQVVRRLFDLVRPVAALFGEKDWQQLQVIAAMTRQQNLPIRVIPVPTIREPDGLAMSSRNVFLSSTDRSRALALHRALSAARGESEPLRAQARMEETLRESGVEPEYCVVRDAQTLLPFPPGASVRPARALIAARVGSVRLIDNSSWPL